MTPSDWIALVVLVLAQLGVAWRFTLGIERRLSTIEGALGIQRD
jgi:hypothetical protein